MESGDEVRIALLGGIEVVRHNERIPLPLGAQRLLAFLALQEDGVHRKTAAEQLWPDSQARQAATNLRSALWQARKVNGRTVIDALGHRLRLACDVSVDLKRILGLIRELTSQAEFGPLADGVALLEALRGELLPNWNEDWLAVEREQWNQARLHALESLAQQFRAAECYLPALQAALAATAIEPIRESAHRAVIEVHIAEGNVASALRHYQRYRSLLHRELGVAPSPRMTQLIRALIPT